MAHKRDLISDVFNPENASLNDFIELCEQAEKRKPLNATQICHHRQAVASAKTMVTTKTEITFVHITAMQKKKFQEEIETQ